MKLIIADDSAVIRAILDQNLTKRAGIEIIASVSNGRRAIDAVRGERPDAVISDIDMPEMDGITAAKMLAGELQVPVLILSEDERARISALHAGAAAFMVKPKLDGYNAAFFDSLMEKLTQIATPSAVHKSDHHAHALCTQSNAQPHRYKVLCIGASTGGPTAVAEVLQGLGQHFPLPVLYTQHIDVGADKGMVEWFDATCSNIRVQLAKDGEEAQAGTVYMAPADRHLLVDYVKANGHPVLRISDEAPERFLRPAVNKLFCSAAQAYKKACLAVLLTGMGRDGAQGCKEICAHGGWTIAEDKSTCAVFGMPAAAIELGAACEVLPRGSIAARVRALAEPARGGA